MKKYWLIDHPLGAFELFGAAHLTALAITASAALAMFVFGGRIPANRRGSIRHAFAGILVTNELLWHIWALSTDQYVLQRMLPLHLCSVMVWLSAAALFINSRKLFGAVYFVGVAGALQALITPDAGPFGFPHFRFLQTMVAHSGVFLAGVYVVAVEGYRPRLQSLWKVFIGLNIYAAVVGVINALIGSNYLFISGKPETASVLDFMPAWPWYIPVLEIVALVLLFALWLPFRRSSPTSTSRDLAW